MSAGHSNSTVLSEMTAMTKWSTVLLAYSPRMPLARCAVATRDARRTASAAARAAASAAAVGAGATAVAVVATAGLAQGSYQLTRVIG
jgi:hypothetical protein